MTGAESRSDLAGLSAVVTGCSPSINSAIARAFVSAGASVSCMDREESYAVACARWLAEQGGQSLALVGDVSDEDDVDRCITEAEERFGGVDILLNGAAIETWKTMMETSLDEMRRHLDVIVGGAFLLTKRCVPSMAARGRGSVINLASTEAHQGRPGNLAYGVSKGAILHMTRCLAMELAPLGIRVNSLTPTGTDASEGVQRAEEWGVKWRPPTAPRRDDFTRGDTGIPLGRRPTPSDYAEAAAFLASPLAGAITGIDLRVDGGVVSRYWRWNPTADQSPEPAAAGNP